MSQENVEFVKRMLDAYNAGDIDTAVNFYTPDVEAHPGGWPWGIAASVGWRGSYRPCVGDDCSGR